MATMPKNPTWRKKKDDPRRIPATLPDYAADLAGPSRQVRRRAAAVLVAQEASADRPCLAGGRRVSGSSAGAGLSGGECGQSGAAMLTAHQSIAIRRRFPEAEVSTDAVRIRLSNGELVIASPDILDGSPTVVSLSAIRVEHELGYDGQVNRITVSRAESAEAEAVEAVLRGMLGI